MAAQKKILDVMEHFQDVFFDGDTIFNTYANSDNLTAMEAFNEAQVFCCGYFVSPQTPPSCFQNTDSLIFSDRILFPWKKIPQKKIFEDGSWGLGPLFKMSWTLTTQTRTVVDSILPGRPHTLKVRWKKCFGIFLATVPLSNSPRLETTDWMLGFKVITTLVTLASRTSLS